MIGEVVYKIQRWVDMTVLLGQAVWCDQDNATYHKAGPARDAASGLAAANKGERYRVLRVEVVDEFHIHWPGSVETAASLLKPGELKEALRSGEKIAAGVCPDCASELDRTRVDLVRCKSCQKSWKRATLAPYGVGWIR